MDSKANNTLYDSWNSKFLIAVIDKGLSTSEIKEKTLDDLIIEDSELKSLFESSWVTVAGNMNLSDAKEKMDQVSDCLDVFITKDGTRGEPVVGWLTNLIITESAKV